MADWQQILFERRLLSWASLLALAGLGLWAAALASPHWLVVVPRPPDPDNYSVPTPLLQAGRGRGLIWAHSGLYSLHSLLEGEQGLEWEVEGWLPPRLPALRSALLMAVISLGLSLAALGFSAFSVRRPYMVVRRLAAGLHLLAAVCTVTVLQMANTARHSAPLHPASPDHQLRYGYSVLLAWAAAIVSLSVSVTFCSASKKRKLLRNDNVTFMNQRLVINEYIKPSA
jgi:hypothetical protein